MVYTRDEFVAAVRATAHMIAVTVISGAGSAVPLDPVAQEVFDLSLHETQAITTASGLVGWLNDEPGIETYIKPTAFRSPTDGVASGLIADFNGLDLDIS